MEKFSTFEELVNLAPIDVQTRLEKLKTFKENPKWHPEGNTSAHIKIVTTRLMETEDINLIIAGLYHDLGKLDTGELKEGTDYNHSHGHEFKSAKLVIRDAEFIESLGGDVEEIHTLVINHMRFKQLKEMRKAKVNAFIAMPTFKKQSIFGLADSMNIEWKL